MSEPYTYLWEYTVAAESIDAFEALYGPSGDWVALFRRATGYLNTRLLRDLEQVGRYITIDRWASVEHHAKFRAEFSHDFETLDRLGQDLTKTEVFLGAFSPA